MLTPKFTISQNDEFVIIVIRVPYVKISSAEFFLDVYNFRFHLNPYLLNITFKQPLKPVNEEPTSSKYNQDTYELTVNLKKQNVGEHFEDLDMLTTLLNKKEKSLNFQKEKKKKSKQRNPLIQIINEESSLKVENQQNDKINEQILPNQIYSCGFNNQYEDFFEDLEEEILELGDINPDIVSINDRIQVRNQILSENFEAEHYLYDLFDNEEEVKEKMRIQLPITKKINQQDSVENSENQKKTELYTDQEWDTLIKLPKKQYILDDKNIVFNHIIDIAFAYFYELRIFDGEFTCESAVTINKISSTLSCFVIDKSISEVLVTCYKRALTYPLIRSFDICKRANIDIIQIFQAGKTNVLKLFLQLKNMFDTSEPRYLLNRLYIEDLCVVIQLLSNDEFFKISQQLIKTNILKSDITDFNLVNLEKGANQVLEYIDKQPLTEEQKQALTQETQNQKPTEITKEEKEEEEKKQQQIIKEQQENQKQKPKTVLIEDITEKLAQTKISDKIEDKEQKQISDFNELE